MPDYRAIYNDVIEREENYNLAQFSPGYQNCVEFGQGLSLLGGRSLDFGCGVGFVLEYLASPPFRFEVYGVDASDIAVERSRSRLGRFSFDPLARVQHVTNSKLNSFEDDHFSLVTSFDVLEHLDEADILSIWEEIQRVLRRGGLFFGSVSCRPSGYQDRFGDNLHRTVRGIDWWVERLQPDRALYDAARSQLLIWKRNFRKPAV